MNTEKPDEIPPTIDGEPLDASRYSWAFKVPITVRWMIAPADFEPLDPGWVLVEQWDLGAIWRFDGEDRPGVEEPPHLGGELVCSSGADPSKSR